MDDTTLATRNIARCTVSAVHGDLTEQRVDAIVNAANSALAHGGGLAGAIVRRGGRVIQEESDRLAPVPVGGAATTGAGALPCRWVIHAVGPRWGEGDEELKLRSAVRSSLAEAARIAATSLAVPAISTGIFGYPKPAGTLAITDELFRWLELHPEAVLREVRLTAFDLETASLFAAAVGSWRHGLAAS
ncbi:MAG TPA: macro domain-containing protein [Thermoanaerobaculales bacterium]|nr:macro domain-containing protein [Thermoanaerobaculales bacterium]HPA80707.1 macro domain-containing protein [Thermoanaerobaculales bacterium]HQL29242.1 macro domain-containing protein [Thermoanaerobaculales bacterium]HQN96184.1 macro domain-containing protein [Thermoanaerobaculales bacterium]HQP44727.1 macro domain-containing protein [Thermoanaerobaculales bacterium]